MKNVYEVLRQKELELSRLEKEVEALRVAAPLLSEDKEAGNDNKPTLALRRRPSSPSAFRRRRSMPPRRPPAPRAGKTPPSAGPKLSCWREACPEGRRLRFDTGPEPGFGL